MAENCFVDQSEGGKPKILIHVTLLGIWRSLFQKEIDLKIKRKAVLEIALLAVLESPKTIRRNNPP
ncbi:hypothetical protein Tco_0416875, partial [Tanacetum coccineum]